MSKDTIVIAGMARTPLGAFQGTLSPMTGPQLGAVAVKAALERSTIPASDVTEVLMGCVLPAAQGQAPARQAAIGAGLPQSVGATTVNKVCGSGMKTVMVASQMIKAGDAKVVVAGGFESMSNAPHLLGSARAGYRLGHGELKDHMFLDGLEDAYNPGKLMGCFADDMAGKKQITREEQDNLALTSLERAKRATEEGDFKGEIAAVTIKSRKGEVVFDEDEAFKMAMPEKIPALRPAFNPEGTVTAANASSISDGAAALVITSKAEAEEKGYPILAEIKGYASHAQAPEEFTIAPVGAMEKLFKQTGWSVGDVDLFEINEAFAMVTLAAMKDLSIPHEKVNVNGGACALGHPLGATGSRIIVTLLGALQHRGLSKGVASLCIGGGEATAIAIERI